MYCPVCFNDTLKIASSGVVKFAFNGKSKSTSQFFYNLTQDTDSDLLNKIDHVVQDYFEYYSNFQNKTPITEVLAYSIDFVCENGCVVDLSKKLNVVGLLFSQEELNNSVLKFGEKYNIPVDL